MLLALLKRLENADLVENAELATNLRIAADSALHSTVQDTGILPVLTAFPI
jgi:hypothetical protein